MRLRLSSVVIVVALVSGGLLTSVVTHAGAPFERTPSWMTPGNHDSLDVALGDFDNDGDLDLASYGEENVQVYLNSYGVMSTAVVWTSTESTGYSGQVLWADINNDDYPELFTSEGMYENINGDLSTTATWTNLSDARVFMLGDVDRDGFVDLILGKDDLVELYENSAGTIDDIPDWNTTEENSPRALALGDVDYDSHLELAVGSYHDPIRVYDNIGGSLNNVSVWNSSLTDYVGCLSWGDINFDNYPELFVCTQPFVGGEPNRIYMNFAGTLETTPSWNSSMPSFAADGEFFDVDDDGDLDLVVANNALMRIMELINGTEVIYLNDAGVIDEDHDWNSTWEDSSHGMDIGDTNGDGYPDLVVANTQDLWYGILDGYNPGRIVIYSHLGPNLGPQISTVSASPAKPETGKSSTITVQATDPDNDQLIYEFSVQPGNGTISSVTGNSAVWEAPTEEGTYVIGVTVEDGKGGYDHRDFQITVIAPSEESFFSLGNVWVLLILLIIIIVVVVAVVAAVVRKRRPSPVEDELPPPPEGEIPPPPK